MPAALPLPVQVCTYTDSYTLNLFFSSFHFSFKHNSFAWKKANCILQQKSRKECCLPSALALIAQVELGLNEYRAGQPRVCMGPSSRAELETETVVREAAHCNTSSPMTNKAWRAKPISSCQGFCRLEKMPTHPAIR